MVLETSWIFLFFLCMSFFVITLSIVLINIKRCVPWSRRNGCSWIGTWSSFLQLLLSNLHLQAAMSNSLDLLSLLKAIILAFYLSSFCRPLNGLISLVYLSWYYLKINSTFLCDVVGIAALNQTLSIIVVTSFVMAVYCYPDASLWLSCDFNSCFTSR